MSIYKSDALDFTCPDCGARPGEKCISLKERRSIEIKTIHAARMKIARKEYRGL